MENKTPFDDLGYTAIPFEPLNDILQEFYKIDNTIIIGGSYGLKLYNKLNRCAKDLDLLVKNDILFDYCLDIKKLEKIETSSDFDKNDNLIDIKSFKYNDIKIDLIWLRNYPKANIINNYNVSDIRDIIQNKQLLIKNNKHILDLEYILNTTNT
jgi:hypothetical protein